MQEVEKTFAIASVVEVIAVGGLLHALYPSGFAASRSQSGDANSSGAADRY
jgi:hypothetical protein